MIEESKLLKLSASGDHAATARYECSRSQALRVQIEHELWRLLERREEHQFQ
jgi:hypothetical protein